MHIQSLTADQSLGSLHTPAAGLSAAEAQRRLAEFEVFSQYSIDGTWMVEGETELIIGQQSNLTGNAS